MNIISSRIGLLKPSGTLAIADLSRKLKSEGKNILDLAEGESDFETPGHIADEAKKAIDDGCTRYTAVDGIPALKKAIQRKFFEETDIEFESANIIVGAGAKQLIFAALMATIDEKDEVVVPSPFWVSYRDIAEVFGGKVITVDLNESSGFVPNVEALTKEFTKKTKWLILNSPNNPTGAVYTKAFFSELEKALEAFPDIMILSDEIYEEITYNGERAPSILTAAPKLKERSLVINGVSKKYAMTGWRIGYAIGPKNLVSAMNTIIGQTTTNACSISQEAAAKAISGSQQFFKSFMVEYKKRRDFIVEELSEIKGLSFAKPEGAFYIFVSCKDFLNKYKYKEKRIQTDVDFVSYVMDVGGVSVVPGTAFGMEGYFRICFAKNQDTLKEAMKRIKDALNLLK